MTFLSWTFIFFIAEQCSPLHPCTTLTASFPAQGCAIEHGSLFLPTRTGRPSASAGILPRDARVQSSRGMTFSPTRAGHPSASADIFPRGARVQSSRGMTFSPTRAGHPSASADIFPRGARVHKKGSHPVNRTRASQSLYHLITAYSILIHPFVRKSIKRFYTRSL